MAPYVVELIPHADAQDGCNVTLRITGGPAGYRPQTFETAVRPIGLLRREGIEPLDLNMDGYMDFHFVSVVPLHSSTVSYGCWCFDPRTQSFQEREEFGDIRGVDPKTGLLYATRPAPSRARDDDGQEYYRLKGGKLDLVKTEVVRTVEEAIKLLPDGYHASKYVMITTLYENGKVKKVYYRAYKDPVTETPPDPAITFWESLKKNDFANMQKLVEKDPKLLEAAASDSWNPLPYAAREGKTKVAEWLLDHGAAIDKISFDYDTPLHIAALNNRIEIVKLLLAHGADPNKQNVEHLTPLDIAQREGYAAIVAELEKAASR